jgi:hypothetical protein
MSWQELQAEKSSEAETQAPGVTKQMLLGCKALAHKQVS